jgi:hypothetical protein
LLVLAQAPKVTQGFTIINNNIIIIRRRTTPAATTTVSAILTTQLNAAASASSSSSDEEDESSTSSSSTSASLTTSMTALESWTVLFPVLSKINGINWEGTCRYVNDELIPQNSLKLMGGIRFDFLGANDVELNSYLIFPNGNRRDIEMRYVCTTSSTTVVRFLFNKNKIKSTHTRLSCLVLSIYLKQHNHNHTRTQTQSHTVEDILLLLFN